MRLSVRGVNIEYTIIIGFQNDTKAKTHMIIEQKYQSIVQVLTYRQHIDAYKWENIQNAYKDLYNNYLWK